MQTRSVLEIPLDGELLKVLASDTRREILLRLAQRRMTLSELSQLLALGKATVSEHLQRLVTAGLVDRHEDPERIWVYHSLSARGRSLMQPERVRFTFVWAMAAFALLLGVLLAAGLAVLSGAFGGQQGTDGTGAAGDPGDGDGLAGLGAGDAFEEGGGKPLLADADERVPDGLYLVRTRANGTLEFIEAPLAFLDNAWVAGDVGAGGAGGSADPEPRDAPPAAGTTTSAPPTMTPSATPMHSVAPTHAAPSYATRTYSATPTPSATGHAGQAIVSGTPAPGGGWAADGAKEPTWDAGGAPVAHAPWPTPTPTMSAPPATATTAPPTWSTPAPLPAGEAVSVVSGAYRAHYFLDLVPGPDGAPAADASDADGAADDSADTAGGSPLPLLIAVAVALTLALAPRRRRE